MKHTLNHRRNRNGLRKDEDQLQSVFIPLHMTKEMHVGFPTDNHVYRELPVTSQQQWKDGI